MWHSHNERDHHQQHFPGGMLMMMWSIPGICDRRVELTKDMKKMRTNHFNLTQKTVLRVAGIFPAAAAAFGQQINRLRGRPP
jgi:hypothetical protein